MRSLGTRLLMLLTPLVLAVPLAAQDREEFEGMIAMELARPGDSGPLDAKLYTDGMRQAMVVTIPDTAPMAGREIRVVTDPASSEVTALMPLPNGEDDEERGLKHVVTMAEAAFAADPPTGYAVTRLGTTQEVAGITCDDYSVVTTRGGYYMCATTDLGRYMMPRIGREGEEPRLPEWLRALGARTVFPLKVWTDDATLLTVTDVRPGAVPAGIFDTDPDGYRLVPDMMW